MLRLTLPKVRLCLRAAPPAFRELRAPRVSPFFMVAAIMQRRGLGTVGVDPALRARMNTLADLFVEAREEISIASESKETTYFNEEVIFPRCANCS